MRVSHPGAGGAPLMAWRMRARGSVSGVGPAVPRRWRDRSRFDSAENRERAWSAAALRRIFSASVHHEERPHEQGLVHHGCEQRHRRGSRPGRAGRRGAGRRHRARNLEKLRSAIGRPESERLAFVPLDVTSEEQARQAIAAAVERFGRIDVLVNNAGYSLLGNLESLTTEQIERQLATNFYGVLYVMRAALPVMRRRRSGHIFNVSSMAGVIGYATAGAYAAAKFAVEGLSLSVAQEVTRFGIEVTLVEPGFFRTDLLAPQSVVFGELAVEGYDSPAAVPGTVAGLSRQAVGRSREARRGARAARRDGVAPEAVLRRERRGERHHRRPPGAARGGAAARGPVRIDGRRRECVASASRCPALPFDEHR